MGLKLKSKRKKLKNKRKPLRKRRLLRMRLCKKTPLKKMFLSPKNPKILRE